MRQPCFMNGTHRCPIVETSAESSRPPRGQEQRRRSDGTPTTPRTAGALKSGGPDRDQTDDLVVANDALYQLSYWPEGDGRYWEIVARK